MLTDRPQSYGWLTIALHWISALLIPAVFGIGFYMVDLSYYDEGYHTLPALHVSLGLLVGFLTLVRILWRLGQKGNPKALPEHGFWIRLASSAMKYALYVMIVAMIITGYLINTAKGDPAMFFDWFGLPATWQLGPDGVDLAGEVHNIVGWLIMILAGLHAAAGLVHHFVIRDRTLKRMLRPERTQS